jgi:hypothetical protein
MKRLLLALIALHASLAAAEARPVTPTVKAGAYEVRLDDIQVTDKKAYAYLLWDIQALGLPDDVKAQDAKLQAGVLALVKGPVAQQVPKAKGVKVDVVRFTQRDDYGAPDWNSVKKVAHYTVILGKKKAALSVGSKPIPGETGAAPK